jgi:hypothetical protein
VLLFSGNPEAARLLFESQAAGYDFEILAKPLHPSKVIDGQPPCWPNDSYNSPFGVTHQE